MFCLFLQLRNNKAKDVCLDQGPLENHTAILYPCHGWGPQVGSLALARRGSKFTRPTGDVWNLWELLSSSALVVGTCSEPVRGFLVVSV